MEAIRILIVKKRSLQSLSCEHYFLLRTSVDANLCKCQSSFFEKITSVNHLCQCVTKSTDLDIFMVCIHYFISNLFLVHKKLLQMRHKCQYIERVNCTCVGASRTLLTLLKTRIATPFHMKTNNSAMVYKSALYLVETSRSQRQV